MYLIKNTKHMKNLAAVLCMLCFFNGFSQSNEEADIKAINKVLKQQRLAWSDNNLEEYMEGYWKSDSKKVNGEWKIIADKSS